jgi:hypothetical protein
LLIDSHAGCTRHDSKGDIMKRSLIHYALVGLLVSLTAVIVGCNGSGSNDDDGVQGSSTIRGNISAFETADATFVPGREENGSFLARVTSWISEALVPCAYAAGNREGIIVYLDGPVSRTTTTAADGSFAFTQLPAGTYGLQFEYEGEQVRYRGRSGQVATITLGNNETVELVNLRISGGKVNIGNIRMIPGDDSE